MGKEFITAVKASEQSDELEEVTIDGRKVKLYRPSDGQLTLWMASMARGRSGDEDAIATFINVVVNCLDRDSRIWIESRLLDRDDPYGLEEIEQLGSYIVEQVSGRPLGGSSDSTPSPTNDGQNSTPTTQPSISYPSPSTVS